VSAVLAAAATSACPIVRATHHGRHGHPVLFRSCLFDELRRADPEAGAREVVRADPGRVLDLEVEDPAVLRDVDVPGDYVALFGVAPVEGRPGPEEGRSVRGRSTDSGDNESGSTR
jgi:CTP:molybdopterin cytidylyltransferase MocA